jgi:hypothetical protein
MLDIIRLTLQYVFAIAVILVILAGLIMLIVPVRRSLILEK